MTTHPDVLQVEAAAGRLLVEAARVRANRCAPGDAHELRHLWAAINAGNSDPCGPHGERCHLDAESIRRWAEQYPAVVGADPLTPPDTYATVAPPELRDRDWRPLAAVLAALAAVLLAGGLWRKTHA